MLASAIHQHESATAIHTPPPSWTPLSSHAPPHPFSLSRSAGLSFLVHTASSHLLSNLHTEKYVSMLFSQIIPSSPPLTMPTSLFSVSTAPRLPCKCVHQDRISSFYTRVNIQYLSLSFWKRTRSSRWWGGWTEGLTFLNHPSRPIGVSHSPVCLAVVFLSCFISLKNRTQDKDIGLKWVFCLLFCFPM